MRRAEQGFTIMELMVVVAIIGLLIGASSMTLRNLTNADLRSAARRTSSAMRFAFDKATVTGLTLRLAIDLEKGELWLEGSEDKVTLRAGREQHVTGKRDKQEGEEPGVEEEEPPEEQKAPKPLFPFFGGGLGGGEEEGEEGMGMGMGMGMGIDSAQLTRQWKADLEPMERRKARFSPLKTLAAKKIKLAHKVIIDSVMTARMTEPVEDKIAYVYFFPMGHSEPAIVHFRVGEEKYYSVVLHPLTGQAKVYPCYYEIPEEFGADDSKRHRTKDLCAAGGAI